MQDLERLLNIDPWTPEIMAIAIAAKKKARAEKGQALNIFVLANDLTRDVFGDFFEKLKKHINKLPNPTRFQLVVRIGPFGAAHWATYDVLISNKQLQIFCLDAAVTTASDKLTQVIDSFPDARAYTYEESKVLYTEKGVNKSKLTKIQTDYDNCAIFTLDHAFHLSNTDTFNFLSKKKFPKSTTGTELVTYDTLPAEMAHIFSNAQSYAVLDNLPKELQTSIVNKKGKTLHESTKNFQEKIIKGIYENRAVKNKKGKFAQEIREFNRKYPEEIPDIIASREGFAFIKNPTSYLEAQSKYIAAHYSPLEGLKDAVGKKAMGSTNQSFSPASLWAHPKLKKDAVILNTLNKTLLTVTDEKAAISLTHNALKKLHAPAKSIEEALLNLEKKLSPTLTK